MVAKVKGSPNLVKRGPVVSNIDQDGLEKARKTKQRILDEQNKVEKLTRDVEELKEMVNELIKEKSSNNNG